MGTQKGDQLEKRGRFNWKIHRFIIMIISISQSLWCRYYHGEEDLTVFEHICFIMATFFILLRIWCYKLLGRLFTFDIGIRLKHYIITEGPYKWIAHPSYLGSIGFLFFLLLFLRFPIIIILILEIAMCIKILERISIEEKFLIEKFGIEYLIFLDTRYKLIPFIY